MDKIIVMHIKDSSGIFGSERVILSLAKGINKTQFHFMLLCMVNESAQSKILINHAQSEAVDVIPLIVKGKIDFRAIVAMRQIFKEHNVAIVHSHDFKSNLYALIASIRTNIKRVTTAHGSTRDSLLKKIYLFFDESIVYLFYDRIVAVSKDLGNYLKKKRIPSGKIAVIQNGINPGYLMNCAQNTSRLFSIPEGHKIFGVIGRLFPDKGHRFFLQALSNVRTKYPMSIALIVGDGPARDEIIKDINKLNLKDSVYLPGVISDIKQVYECIDFLVIPSLREGLPYVLLEAMVLKIPVIATAVGDIPLVLKDRMNGHLVLPGDSEALEKRMMEVLKDSKKSVEMAEEAYNLVMEEFSEKRMITDTERLYVSLANN